MAQQISGHRGQLRNYLSSLVGFASAERDGATCLVWVVAGWRRHKVFSFCVLLHEVSVLLLCEQSSGDTLMHTAVGFVSVSYGEGSSDFVLGLKRGDFDFWVN